MGGRFMRLFVMFDLPTYSSHDKREYRRFRKFLKDNGFIMFQYSVYTKIVMNRSVLKYFVAKVKENSPKEGEISIMSITEKQFNDIEIIVGGNNNENINSSERNIFL